MPENIWKKTLDDIDEKTQRLRKTEDVFFVSLQGDNTDGLTWDTAFTDLYTAVATASADKITRIFIGKGIFDVYTNNPMYDYLKISKPIHLIGAGMESTILINSGGINANCYVLDIRDAIGYVEQLTITSDGSIHNGIRIYRGDGSIIEKCRIKNGVAPCCGVKIQSSSYAIVRDCEISVWDCGIRMQSSDHNTIKDCIIRDISSEGVHSGYATNANNEYINVRFSNVDTGLQIIDGENETFMQCSFYNNDCGVRVQVAPLNTRLIECTFTGCDTNIDDSSVSTSLINIASTFINAIYPDDLTGITLPNSGTPNVYGANTAIIPAETIGKPFRILAYTAAPSNDNKFIVRLSADSGVTHFIHMMDRRDGNTGELARTLVLDDTVHSKGTEISGSIKCEVGDETMEIWLYYQLI